MCRSDQECGNGGNREPEVVVEARNVRLLRCDDCDTERVVDRQLASGEHRATCAHRMSFVQGTNDRQSSPA